VSRVVEVAISYLGVDVGGSKVAFLLESEGQDSYQTSFQWPRTTTGVAGDLRALSEHLLRLRSRWREPIASVGVAMPATVDGSGRVVAWPSRPAWIGLDLELALRELFPGTEIRYADDGDLAAVAEARRVNCTDLVYLGVGTGIGGGIVVGGRSCPGLARGSCEIGHLVVDRFGPDCDCGRRGCLQAVASGPTTLRRAADLCGRAVTSAQLRQAFTDRQPWAVSAVEESSAALAVGVVSVAELTHPSLVLIGGGFAVAFPGLVATVSAHAARLARPGHPTPPIRPAALGGLSSLHGAVLAARGLAELSN
jgi:kanosamine 6-kinase